MKKIASALLGILAVCSCGSDKKCVIDVTASNLSDSTEVFVSKLAVNRLIPVDTLVVIKGKTKCEINGVTESPDFFYVTAPDGQQVALVLMQGSSVKVNLDDMTVSGSEESELFNKTEKEFSEFSKRFAEKVNAVANAAEPDIWKKASQDLSKCFVDFKRQSITQIMKNPASITNIAVLFRKVSPEMPVFGDANDVYLMQTVLDTLSVLYPNSPYVLSLEREIGDRNNRREMAGMIASAQTVPFPEITLPDIRGSVRNLSDLSGNVILLVFWTSGMESASMMNAELKELYEKYHGDGLEIYQVALDMDKTQWAGAVRSQSIKWTSVIDTRGADSNYLSLYMVPQVPAAIVIGKDGSILEKNFVNVKKLDSVISSAVKK